MPKRLIRVKKRPVAPVQPKIYRRKKKIQTFSSTYFPVHAHGELSQLDGTGSIPNMVKKVASLNQKGLALTDHGHLAGCLSLYKECKANDIVPFPGSELYVTTGPDEKEDRYHLIVAALNLKGYRGLIKLSSLSYTRERFHRKPLVWLSDLADLGEECGDDILVTTGCFFGLVVQTLYKDGYDAAKRVVEMLAGWFPNLHVELQNHNITQDDGRTDHDLAMQMFKIANELGLPVIAGQDSHYLEHEHKPAHDLMKTISYGGGDESDYTFPGDSFHLATSEWVSEHWEPEVWSQIEQGHENLLELNTLVMPALDNFKFCVPGTTKFSDAKLEKATWLGLDKRGVSEWDHYRKRIKDELKTIEIMGFASYFTLTAKIIGWCDDNNIVTNVRGSANGSLVCWALGITEVDPIEWDTNFDRFLHVDRIKPPDIDLDVESSQRQAVIDYMRGLYPTMVQIGTWSKLGMSQEIDETTGELVDRGSLLVQYHASRRRVNGHYTEEIEQRHKAPLAMLEKLDVRKSAGAHAAGFVLPSDERPISDYLPTMLIASSETTVTQPMMDDVEDAGYVKFDLLGLRSLATFSETLALVGLERNDIPWDDKPTCKALRSGRTDGIFQFDGYSTLKGAKRMQVKSTADAILCLALYRPALMAGGQTEDYLKNRKQKFTPKYHGSVDRVLESTNGVMVYQEQIMEVMMRVGMSVIDYNAVMKAVKASNDKVVKAAETFKRIESVFLRKCSEKGISKDISEHLWSMIVGFTEYGFGKCITGDTEFTKGDNSTETIESLYTLLNDLGPPRAPKLNKCNRCDAPGETLKRGYCKRCYYRYNQWLHRGLQIWCHEDGRVKLGHVKTVHKNGVKPVWKVTLENGSHITGTADHRHLTPNGWVEVQNLRIGDELLTPGEADVASRIATNRSTGNPSHLKNGHFVMRREIRAPQICEFCGIHGVDIPSVLEIAHIDSNPQNNDRSNLKLLCQPCHKKLDHKTGSLKKRWTKGRPLVSVAIVSIEYAGEKMTYDIEMKGGDHSWVGNGIVTHNSHATSYGILSYRMAYLKVHHPLEFMCSLLAAWAGNKKETKYQIEAKRLGFRIVRPDVNSSGASWKIHPTRKATLTQGFMTIKGIGEKAALKIEEERYANGDYKSLEDFVERLPARPITGIAAYKKDGSMKGVLKILNDAGSFRSLPQQTQEQT